MPTYRLELEYDGEAFEGWQVQPGDHRTVQGVLEEAVARVTGEAVRMMGSGRTDSGVSAEGQVAALRLAEPRDPGRLQRALNGVLPEDVAVRACAAVGDDFQPRYGARRKLYRYRVWNGPERSPLRRRRWHHVRTPLDLAAMREAAAHLLGEHDFAAFQAAGSDVATSVRRLDRVDLSGAPGGEIVVEVEGPGFLRHMVRILVGTLIDVGLGRREAGELSAILAGRDRTAAGRTAPAGPLTLVRVDYAQAGEGAPPPEGGPGAG